MTAAENIAQDFAWIVLVLNWLGGFLTQIGPALTLAGAVWLYFIQKKKERIEGLRLARQAVYIDYLEASRQAAFAADGSEASKALAKMKAVIPHHQKLTLLAPDEVVRASLVFMNSHVRQALNQKDRKSKNSQATIDSPIRARQLLILEMRRDIFQGTEISEHLTSVEDLGDGDF